MPTVTFDTTTRPDDPLVLKTLGAGWQVAFASVSAREARGTDFEVHLESHGQIPELGVWDQSAWDVARWADKAGSDRLDAILAIVSNRSFPRRMNQLTEGQLHQLRDSMILEAHSAAHRDLFVTADLKAFIGGGRREQLEALLSTRILTPAEFEAELVTQLSPFSHEQTMEFDRRLAAHEADRDPGRPALNTIAELRHKLRR